MGGTGYYSLGGHAAGGMLAVVGLRGIWVNSIDVYVNGPGLAEDGGELLFHVGLFVIKVVTDYQALLVFVPFVRVEKRHEPSFL